MTAYFNRVTRAVWVDAGSTASTLRTAVGRRDAYFALGEAGYVRFGNWVPAYGPVVSCPVALPE